MKYFSTIIIILLIILPGCEFLLDYKINAIELKEAEHQPKLCVYACYYDGRGLSLNVTHTRSLTDKQKVCDIPEVTIRFSKSGNFICLDTTLSLNECKTFINIERFSVLPHEGDTLYISVKADGYDAVHGRTVAPATIPIDTLIVTNYYTNNNIYRFTLFFTDPKSENFYFVSSIYHLTTYFSSIQGYWPPSDTTYQNLRVSVNLTDPVFDFMPDFRTSVKEPFDNSDRKPRIFSDKGFMNSKYGLNIEVPKSKYFDANEPDRSYESSYELELYSISKDLFETFKSSYLNELVEGDIYAEPVYFYSNMSNKVGFFGAYSRKSSKSAVLVNGEVLDLFNKNYEWYL